MSGEQQHPSDFPPGINLVDYPFPLRPDVIVHLVLPRDLKDAEARRIIDFLMAVVID